MLLLTTIFVVAALCQAAFVEPQLCNLNTLLFRFERFVVDAALDETSEKLKFVINTQVVKSPHTSVKDGDYLNIPNSGGVFGGSNIIVSDVNPTTNMFTTFRVEIEFMGKTFIKQNLRLCDMLVVKNTTEFMNGPRFVNPITGVPYSSNSLNPDLPSNRTKPYPIGLHHNTTHAGKREDVVEGQGSIDILMEDIEEENIKETKETKEINDKSNDEEINDKSNDEETNDKNNNEETKDKNNDEETNDKNNNDETNDKNNNETKDKNKNQEINNEIYHNGVHKHLQNQQAFGHDFNDQLFCEDDSYNDDIFTTDKEDWIHDHMNSQKRESHHSTPITNSTDLMYTGPNRFVGQPPSLATSNSLVQQMFNSGYAGCPLYLNDSVVIYYEANVREHFHRLGSYTVKFSIISNEVTGDDSGVLGCNKFYVTPVQPKQVTLTLFVGVIVLMVVTLAINCFTIVYSSYQESSNPFLIMASTICNERLLRQLDSTLPRIVLYLQFALFVAGLDLQYPGFYQPLIGQVRWCALLGYSILYNDSRAWKYIYQDNIYNTFNSGGLKTLTMFASSSSISVAWKNFMVCLVVFFAFLIASHELFILLKFTADRVWRRYGWYERNSVLGDEMQWGVMKNISLLAGQGLNLLMVIFAKPFLILTSFMFLSAGDEKRTGIFPDNYTLRQHAYSMTTDYQSLISPLLYFTVFNEADGTLTTLTPGQFNNTAHSTNTTADPLMYVMRHDVKNGGIPVINLVFGLILIAAWVLIGAYFVFSYVIEIRNRRIVVNRNVFRLYGQVKTILMWYFFYREYNPANVLFMIIDWSSLLIRSLIVGCLQSYGMVQVVLLIVLEFAMIILLIIWRPYYGKIGWISPIWTLPAGRFLVTFMCVAYIKELDLSESVRTYVSYVQLTLHVVCALLFVINMFIVLGQTILSMWRKDDDIELVAELVSKRCFLDFRSERNINDDFEYMPGDPVRESVFQPKRLSLAYEPSLNESVSDEDLYFRAKSAKNAQDYVPESPQVDPEDFFTMEKYSNKRKQTTDYRVREGDYIYRKFFVDDDIDPEVKALWASRKEAVGKTQEKIPEKTPAATHETKQAKSHWAWAFWTKKPKEQGFFVDRPRPLVVRGDSNDDGRRQESSEESLFLHKESF